MKYQLTNLIKSLSVSESRNFTYHSNIFYENSDKHFTRLYDALKKEKADEYDENLLNIIDYTGTPAAFSRLKNRLIEKIEGSLLQLHAKKHSEFKVYHYLQLYQLACDKLQFQNAKEYLKKAKKTALKIENYELLLIISRKLVNIVNVQLKEDPTEYIQEQQQLIKMVNSILQLDQLIASIQYELTQTNFLSQRHDIIQKINELSQQLMTDEYFKNSAQAKLKVYQSVRSILLQKRDFEALATYLIQSLKDFEQHEIYTKDNSEKKVVHMVWIINSLLKTKQYHILPDYVNQLFDYISLYDRKNYEKYIWFCYQSRLVQYIYSKQLHKGVELLLKFEQEELPHQPPSVAFYFNRNLCALYFCNNQLNKSLEQLAMVIADVNFNKLSEELQLRMLILEIIIHTETGNVEYPLSRIREIKRKFNPLLKEDNHIRDRQFVNILMTILKKPAPFTIDKFVNKVNDFIEHSPEFEPGSNEIIDYAIWLKAKIEQKNYYELLPQLF